MVYRMLVEVIFDSFGKVVIDFNVRTWPIGVR